MALSCSFNTSLTLSSPYTSFEHTPFDRQLVVWFFWFSEMITTQTFCNHAYTSIPWYITKSFFDNYIEELKSCIIRYILPQKKNLNHFPFWLYQLKFPQWVHHSHARIPTFSSLTGEEMSSH